MTTIPSFIILFMTASLREALADLGLLGRTLCCGGTSAVKVVNRFTPVRTISVQPNDLRVERRERWESQSCWGDPVSERRLDDSWAWFPTGTEAWERFEEYPAATSSA